MEAVEAVKLARIGCLCWVSLFDRPKLGLQPGDVMAAILWFETQTGRLPDFICLHPKYQSLATEVPAGVEVRYVGALGWECQLGINQVDQPLVGQREAPDGLGR